MFCLNHRLNLTKTLRPGSWVMLNTRRWTKTSDGVFKPRYKKDKNNNEIEDRATVYGFVVTSSDKYITVASPRLVWQENEVEKTWQ
jgi:hypothetical protein